MKYTVVKNDRYTGVTYNYLNDSILAHHASQGEILIPVETSPWPVSTENGMPIYSDVDIDILKQGKLWQLADSRWREETGGYIYKGHEFHSDRESQARIFQAYIASLNDTNFAVTWKTKTGWLEMTANDFIALYNEFQTFLQDLYQKEKSLQEQVEATTTIEDLNAIKW